MKRQPPYGESSLNHPYGGHQQHLQDGGVSERPYRSGRVESQWDRRDLPSLSFNAGQGGSAARSYHQSQSHETKLGLENQASKQARAQPHEQDMEIGYVDNTFPMTYEGLERNFIDDVLKLVKEQNDAEDAENARHREKIAEINTRYQEKLSSLRAQQANRRREFLHKESEVRLNQYHEAGIDHYPNTGLQDARGYCSPAVAGTAGEPHRGYVYNEFKSYQERPPSVGRAPYPESQIYNSGARYY